MKKAHTLLLTSALLFSTVAPVLANDKSTVNEEQAMPENFTQLTGKITSIEKGSDGFNYVHIEQKDNLFSMIVDQQTKVVDNTGAVTELKEGMTFTAYMSANKPMILIYPPRYTPELIIVDTKQDGIVTVDIFDKDFATDGLTLTIDHNTIIEDLAGNILSAADIVDNDVAVFYTMTTRSLPAKTTPSKIIVLATPAQQVQQIIDFDQYHNNGVTMVPLRLIAEKLGWEVTSNGQGALLRKGNVTYTVTRGDTKYGYNRALLTLEAAPELLELNKTYVPLSFIQELQK